MKRILSILIIFLCIIMNSGFKSENLKTVLSAKKEVKLKTNKKRATVDLYTDYIDVHHDYVIFLADNNGGSTYTFDIPNGGNTFIAQIPEGAYNVSIFEKPPVSPAPETMSFWIGSNQYTGPGGYFGVLNINSFENNTIMIYPN